MSNNEATFELKIKINKLKQCIDDNKGELEKTISELQSVCSHDIAKIENIYDYDRSRYEIECVNCNKTLSYCNHRGLTKFKEEYKGKLI